jgi:hypothetical protein
VIRRGLLGGLLAVVAAPALVRAGVLMPVKCQPLRLPPGRVVVVIGDIEVGVHSFPDLGHLYVAEHLPFAERDPMDFIRLDLRDRIRAVIDEQRACGIPVPTVTVSLS